MEENVQRRETRNRNTLRSSSGSSSRMSATSLAVVGAASLCFLVAFLVLGTPMPEGCGTEARLEYIKQVFMVITGLGTYDVEALNKAMVNACESPKLPALPPNALFHLSPLREIDPFTNKNWLADFEEEFIVRERPVVVRKFQYFNQGSTFPAAREWSLASLRAHMGGTLVPVFTNVTNDKSVVWMPFGEFESQMTNRTRVLYARCLEDRAGKLASGMDTRGLFAIMGKAYAYDFTKTINQAHVHCLFVGSNHVKTRMHSDVGTSAFLMVEGRKRWTMFPPSEAAYFLPVPHGLNVAYNSLVDIFTRDAEGTRARFPLLSRARGYETVLAPGDILFFPSFTWHGVENLDEKTFGIDLPVYDVFPSFRRNPILTAGTFFNLKVWTKAIGKILSGQKGSMKEIFFEGYYRDEEQREIARRLLSAAA